MMWWWNDAIGWGGWVVMTLIMVAFWSLVVFGAIALFGGDQGRGTKALQDPDPLKILDERFARGDIEVDDYYARRDALRAVR